MEADRRKTTIRLFHPYFVMVSGADGKRWAMCFRLKHLLDEDQYTRRASKESVVVVVFGGSGSGGGDGSGVRGRGDGCLRV